MKKKPTKYLSCYQPNFYQTLTIGSWEHLKAIPTVTVKFVLATFVHIRNISAVNDSLFDQTLEQMPTVMVTFVQATYVLATFVHISNISAVTGLFCSKFWVKKNKGIKWVFSLKFWSKKSHLSISAISQLLLDCFVQNLRSKRIKT